MHEHIDSSSRRTQHALRAAAIQQPKRADPLPVQ
jgi:hypothetical protein